MIYVTYCSKFNELWGYMANKSWPFLLRVKPRVVLRNEKSWQAF